jgi:hypothetical protein
VTKNHANFKRGFSVIILVCLSANRLGLVLLGGWYSLLGEKGGDTMKKLTDLLIVVISTIAAITNLVTQLIQFIKLFR